MTNMKKFEEGIFSDLRNLKPGSDACLEDPKVSRALDSPAPVVVVFFSTRVVAAPIARR